MVPAEELSADELEETCAWLQEHLGGVLLVGRPGIRPVGTAPRVVPAPSGCGRLERLVIGAAALPPDVPVVVYVDGHIADWATRALVPEMLALLEEDDAAVARAVQVTDALKQVSGDRLVGSVDRHGLYTLQTPQIIRRTALEAAFASAPGGPGGPGDAVALLLARGYPVRMVGLDPSVARRARRSRLHG